MLQKNTLVKAKAAARKAFEALYDGTCNIIEHKQVKNEETKVTSHKEVTVITDEPCRLSFESDKVAKTKDMTYSPSQNVKLFLSPDVTVKAGSKIIVTQSGVTTKYKSSGMPNVYDTHQEVPLELFERWT